MPVSLEVGNDGRVLYYQIADPWEIEDLMAAYTKEKQIRDEAPHVVHSVSNFSHARRIPKNWWQARYGPGLKHPRAGEMVFVGLNPGLNRLVDVILRVTNFKRIKVFNTMDEAQKYVDGLLMSQPADKPDTAAHR